MDLISFLFLISIIFARDKAFGPCSAIGNTVFQESVIYMYFAMCLMLAV